MSAPITPQEMADVVRRAAMKLGYGSTQSLLDATELWTVEAYLRRQPTDAQKMEALQLASYAAEDGGSVADEIEANRDEPWRWDYPRYWPSYGVSRAAAANARLAMRLLGLPTGDERQ